ncbi:succinyl-diaminopimelate desuccinylase [soil metagenome]
MSAATVTDRLVDLLVDLVDMPCVTGDEDRIAGWLADRYDARGEQVTRVGNSVVAGGPADDRPVVLLVGHTDVVPPNDGDLPGRVEGDRVVGRGTSDMKAGLAVAMDLFEDPVLRDGPVRLQLIAYAGEEGPHDGNELVGLLDAQPDLCAADLGIVLEPTDLEVQLGCMGGLHARIVVPGRAAHSARPWHGVNALTAAAPLLSALGRHEPVDRMVDGLPFRDVLTATQAWTDNAHNVVPDRFTVNVNYRFAPDRTLDTAEDELRMLIAATVGDDITVTIADRAPPAPPHRDHRMVQQVIAASGGRVAAKQAWTDVARLADVGVPALNYGPGLTGQAHQAGEYVPVANLAPARRVLADFLTTCDQQAVASRAQRDDEGM